MNGCELRSKNHKVFVGCESVAVDFSCFMLFLFCAFLRYVGSSVLRNIYRFCHLHGAGKFIHQDPAEGLANATEKDIPWAASRLVTRISSDQRRENTWH